MPRQSEMEPLCRGFLLIAVLSLLVGCTGRAVTLQTDGGQVTHDLGFRHKDIAPSSDAGGGADLHTAQDTASTADLVDMAPVSDLATDGPGPTTWAAIKPGTFLMGSPTSEPCGYTSEVQHQVTLTHAFEIQSTEVTQGQFEALMGYNPASFSPPYSNACVGTCPVERVTWHEAAAYCNALSKQKGLASCYTCAGSGEKTTCSEAASYTENKVYSCPGYRLPTEAEWEYAYRAGTKTALYSGAITSCDGEDPNLTKIGWYLSNSGLKTHAVGQKQPNAWKLYDMSGNVWEWCHDWIGSYSYSTSNMIDPVNEKGPVYPLGLERVRRGGSWLKQATYARAAYRSAHKPSMRSYSIGFRVVRGIP